MVRKTKRMPAHIVLPNGMWRFVKGKTKSMIKRTSKVRKKKRKSGGFPMVKRRYSRRASRRGSRGIGGGLGGISLKGILVGFGAATAADGFVPNVIPYQDVAEGAIAGKIAKTGVLSGAIGGFVKTFLKGGTVTTATGVYN